MVFLNVQRNRVFGCIVIIGNLCVYELYNGKACSLLGTETCMGKMVLCNRSMALHHRDTLIMDKDIHITVVYPSNGYGTKNKSDRILNSSVDSLVGWQYSESPKVQSGIQQEMEKAKKKSRFMQHRPENLRIHVSKKMAAVQSPQLTGSSNPTNDLERSILVEKDIKDDRDNKLNAKDIKDGPLKQKAKGNMEKNGVLESPESILPASPVPHDVILMRQRLIELSLKSKRLNEERLMDQQAEWLANRQGTRDSIHMKCGSNNGGDAVITAIQNNQNNGFWKQEQYDIDSIHRHVSESPTLIQHNIKSPASQLHHATFRYSMDRSPKAPILFRTRSTEHRCGSSPQSSLQFSLESSCEVNSSTSSTLSGF